MWVSQLKLFVANEPTRSKRKLCQKGSSFRLDTKGSIWKVWKTTISLLLTVCLCCPCATCFTDLTGPCKMLCLKLFRGFRKVRDVCRFDSQSVIAKTLYALYT